MDYRVYAGDVKELMIDNIEYPVPEGATCKIRYTVGTSMRKENEITVCTAKTSVLKAKNIKAGFTGLKVILREDLESHFANIKDNGLMVPVLLTVADGATYSGNLMVSGDPEMESEDRGMELSMEGNYFTKQGNNG